MSDLNSWKQFAVTGKVEDYLKYAVHDAQKDVGEGQEPEKNAGFAHGDRTQQIFAVFRTDLRIQGIRPACRPEFIVSARNMIGCN